jgi:hypothetical protein
VATVVMTNEDAIPRGTHRGRTMGHTLLRCPILLETEEVLAGYWVVECDSFDRATEIAARLADYPAPEHVRATAVADVRLIDDYGAEPGM